MFKIKMGKNEFYIEEANEIIARIQFIPSGKDINGRNIIVVNHTLVYDGHNGLGLGKTLVNTLAQYARKEELSIVPVCPYAKKILEATNITETYLQHD